MKLIIMLVFAHAGYTPQEHARLAPVYQAALKPGTWRNRRIQAQSYCCYMAEHLADPLQPHPYDIASYAIELSYRLKAPTSVANYLSGAASWVGMAGGSTSAFIHTDTVMIKKGIVNLSDHVPAPATPISTASSS